MPIAKRDYQPSNLHVEAFGHEFEMRRVTAAEWVAMRRDDDDGDLLRLALDAVVDSSLPDGAEISLTEGQSLLAAWIRAHKDDAVPPA